MLYKNRKKINIKQRDLTDCGPACIASVAAFYNSKIPVAKIRQSAGTDQKGTSAYGIIKAFQSIGMTAKGIRCKPEHLYGVPLPAIAHLKIDEKLLHYVVVYKVGKNSVKIMNPSSGKLYTLDYSTFIKQWSGIMIISAPEADYKPAKESVSNRERFLFLLKPHKKVYIQAILGAMLYTILGFSTSMYLQKLTDYIIAFQLEKALHVAGVIMLLILLFQQLFSVMKSRLVLKTGQLIDARLILGYFNHLMILPQTFFDRMRNGEIISRINDAGKIRMFLSDSIINILLNSMILIFSLTLLFFIQPKLALVVSLLLPLFAGLYAIINQLNKKQERNLMESSAELESQLIESMQNVRTIKQLNLEGQISSEVEWRFMHLLKHAFKSGTNGIFSRVSTDTVSKLFTIITLWCGASFVLSGSLTIGQMLSFYAILAYLSGPASALVGMNTQFQNAKIAADRLFEILELDQPKLYGNVSTEKLRERDVIFKEVSFSYGTRSELFRDLNLRLPGGKITLITGESGSGKSSLVHLINGQYETDKGAVYIGSHRVKDYNQETISRLISIVPQQVELFTGSILSNIAPWADDIDYEKIITLCNKLGLDDLLQKLPQRLDTFIGPQGYALSGGEKQRIAIARSLYRNPDILILDEPSSALDAVSEEKLTSVLKEEKEAGKTIIIISHQLEGFSFADHKVTMANGIPTGV